MAEIEVGVFIFLNIVAGLGFFATIKYGFGVLLILSFVILSGLALYSFGELEVVQTKRIPAVNASSTTYDAGGNVLQVKNATLPAYDEKQVIINSDFDTLGWIYFLGAGVAMTWFLKIIIKMFQNRKRIVASGYWENNSI